MKRMLEFLLAVVLWVTHPGTADAEPLIDMDLASSNRMMTYAQMLQVFRSPETFEGQIFRLKGKFNYSQVKEQAKIIFTEAERMVKKSPALSNKIRFGSKGNIQKNRYGMVLYSCFIFFKASIILISANRTAFF